MCEGIVLESSFEDWNVILQVNLIVFFFLIKVVMLYLIEIKGLIVNIGLIEGFGFNFCYFVYCVFKVGLYGFICVVVVDYGFDGVCCNVVVSGWIDIDLNVVFIESFGDFEVFCVKIGDIYLFRCFGVFKEVGVLVVWFVLDVVVFVIG